MRLYSTNKKSPIVTFREALFTGQAVDGGLYMPDSFPQSYDNINSLPYQNYNDFASTIAKDMLCEEMNDSDVASVINNAYDFTPQIKMLNDKTFCLELYHGPSLSFKDFGARFMAHAMCHFLTRNEQKITILVATSGDTGSAVAQAYHNVDGIRVVLLYPSGKVSKLQEQQLTTIGGNVHALEVEGTFDDCQALVKRAFADQKLRDKVALTSANSINIGRLLPQSLYYGWAITNLLNKGLEDIIVCVPSGNFGNLCGGLIAHHMGLPVKKFIAAVNANNVIPEYMKTGQYNPRPSVKTLSNAMDVGNPSNWARIRDLYDDNIDKIHDKIWTTSVNDQDTVKSIKSIFEKDKYIIDPHTAVGFEAISRFRNEYPELKDNPAIVLSTAHPGKFYDIVINSLNIEYELPTELRAVLTKEKTATKIENDYNALTDILL